MSAPAGSPAPPPDLVPIRRALLSVSDKTGLIEFASGLAALGVELLSTGGSAGDLRAAGLTIREVSDLTGFPEIMGGRVKTLHPRVHGGLLARRDDPDHRAAMAEHGIEPIDLLVVNLYPFERVRASGADVGTIIENIDVGGPAMIRAAAKNHAFVAVVTDPADYKDVLDSMRGDGGALSLAHRRDLAAFAFARTAAYDAAIATWFADEFGWAAPRHFTVGGKLAADMRYGENPHQRAGLYLSGDDRPGAATAKLIQGKALSFNNVADADAAFELAAEFDPARTAAAVIVKHGNPCGAAEAPTLDGAYRKALACDPVSAFGGVVALNRTLDADAARAIAEIFTEVIVAPDASDEAKAVLSERKNLRLLLTGALPDPRAPGRTVRSVAGGFLLQDRDTLSADDLALDVVTKRAPTEAELADLRFAFRVAKHVKSNAIVYARDGATVGVGAGQMSRVDACRIAAIKAEDAARAAGETTPRTRSSVVASDAFFPFADGLLAAVEAGATAVIQPGGSVRDEDVIAAADAHGIAMVFTGVRHFRH